MDAQLKIRLPEELKRRADSLAKDQMVTLSVFARVALHESVKRAEQAKLREGAGREAAVQS